MVNYLTNPSCSARREQDEYACPRCGLRWDIKDKEPPSCYNVGLAIKQETHRIENNLNRISKRNNVRGIYPQSTEDQKKDAEYDREDLSQAESGIQRIKKMLDS